MSFVISAKPSGLGFVPWLDLQDTDERESGLVREGAVGPGRDMPAHAAVLGAAEIGDRVRVVGLPDTPQKGLYGKPLAVKLCKGIVDRRIMLRGSL